MQRQGDDDRFNLAVFEQLPIVLEDLDFLGRVVAVMMLEAALTMENAFQARRPYVTDGDDLHKPRIVFTDENAALAAGADQGRAHRLVRLAPRAVAVVGRRRHRNHRARRQGQALHEVAAGEPIGDALKVGLAQLTLFGSHVNRHERPRIVPGASVPLVLGLGPCFPADPGNENHDARRRNGFR